MLIVLPILAGAFLGTAMAEQSFSERQEDLGDLKTEKVTIETRLDKIDTILTTRSPSGLELRDLVREDEKLRKELAKLAIRIKSNEKINFNEELKKVEEKLTSLEEKRETLSNKKESLEKETGDLEDLGTVKERERNLEELKKELSGDKKNLEEIEQQLTDSLSPTDIQELTKEKTALVAKMEATETKIAQEKKEIEVIKKNKTELAKLEDEIKQNEKMMGPLREEKKLIQRDEFSTKSKIQAEVDESAQKAQSRSEAEKAAYGDCVGSKNEIECAQTAIDKLRKDYKTAQIDLKECNDKQTKITKEIDCEPLKKIRDEAGAKITRLQIIVQTNQTIDVGKILQIEGQVSFKKIDVLLGKVIDLLVKLIGTVALVFLVIGGFRLVVAAGNDNEMQKAKSMIIYAVIGLIVVLLAFLVVELVRGLLYR